MTDFLIYDELLADGLDLWKNDFGKRGENVPNVPKKGKKEKWVIG